MIKNTVFTLLAVFLASFAFTATAEVVEKIVAVVSDKAITLSDLEEEAAIERQLGNSADKAKILDYMIEREIVSAEAGRLGLTVAMDEVSRELVRFEGTFPSREEFNRFLSAYETDLQELSRRFASYIYVSKIRQQKEAISPDRYEKWLAEAKKKADIKIVNTE